MTISPKLRMSLISRLTACVLFGFVILCALAERNEDLHGWQNTRWNMTTEQVMAVVSGARTGETGCDLSGYRCALVVNNTSILDIPFEISFQFTLGEDKLKIIHLSCLEHIVGTTDAYFERIEHALIEKYGVPRHQKTIKRGRDIDFERTWVLGRRK